MSDETDGVLDDQYIVKPVYKAARLLRAVGEAPDGLTLADACAATGLPRSTAFKYLRTLAASGFVVHEPERDTYRGGLLLWQLGLRNGGPRRIADVALPAMRQLADRFNETVNLGVLEGTDVVYVEIVEGDRALRMGARIGSRDATHATALGKAMMSQLPDDSWRARLPRRLRARTANTITTVGALAAELEQIRRDGVAWDREENEEGLSCVAAPVLGPVGQVVAAISVAAPTTRMNAGTIEALVPALVAATHECSAALRSAPA